MHAFTWASSSEACSIHAGNRDVSASLLACMDFNQRCYVWQTNTDKNTASQDVLAPLQLTVCMYIGDENHTSQFANGEQTRYMARQEANL